MTDLRDLAREAMTYANVTGSATLSIKFHPKYFPVNLDRILFRQVLYNLFINAIQAMPNGGEILLDACKLDDGKTLLCVSDQGGNRRDDDEKDIRTSFTNKKEGVGLGLSLCRELVTRHGGSIKAKSSLNKGTTIEIEIPEENSVAKTDESHNES